MRRRIALGAALVAAILGALALRVVLEGRAALADGDRALAEHRPGDAIAAWESAARWYLPGAPHVDDAYDRLLDLARTSGSPLAWRAIRRAALATRSLWTPHADALAEANAALAAAAGAAPDGAQRRAYVEPRLQSDPHPARGWFAVTALGIVLWLIGAYLVVTRWPGATSRPVQIGALLALGGILAWALGLYSV